MVAANSAVAVPTRATIAIASGAALYSADMRHTMYTPAVTMVAAWISAETGVGPAIASGSQTYSGICADLPQAPMNSKMPTPVNNHSAPAAFWNSPARVRMCRVPNSVIR